MWPRIAEQIKLNVFRKMLDNMWQVEKVTFDETKGILKLNNNAKTLK
jgi:hypothetical protein